MDKASSSLSTKCDVCNYPHYGNHFGVLACRSCASFFRRTVFERKNYKCRKDNDCVIKEPIRNACKACRLQQCLRAGMRQEARKEQIALELLLETRLLDRYRDGFRNFVSGEKSLFTLDNPQTIFSELQYKPLKLDNWMRMEWGCVSFMHAMFTNYFDPFTLLPHAKRVEVLKHYWKYFQALYSAYLSVAAVPYFEQASTAGNMSQNDAKVNKFVIHYGYYGDMDTLRIFFPKEVGTDPDKVVSYFEPLMKPALTYGNQYYQLNITELELVAMIAILFWNTVDKFGLLNTEMRQKRETVFVELNSMLIRTLGGINGSIRLGQIVSFLQITMGRAVEMNELWRMVKILLPQFRDAWDDDVWKEFIRKE
ncbi:zinc finger, c4 type (two domains) domain-containing protein [Ditylenchus destructor]|nr:zinc finger, c4 type (two domains) domain-containing protein [Ditylenchus destructor]